MNKDVTLEARLQIWTQEHLLHMLLLALEHEELADMALATTSVCVSSKRGADILVFRGAAITTAV